MVGLPVREDIFAGSECRRRGVESGREKEETSLRRLGNTDRSVRLERGGKAALGKENRKMCSAGKEGQNYLRNRKYFSAGGEVGMLSEDEDGR